MVWTVNAGREIRYWLGRPIDVLVTDRPALAIALREQRAARGRDQGISPAGTR
jgi:hypothetical protein